MSSRNPAGQQDGHKAFKAVSEAYEVVVCNSPENHFCFVFVAGWLTLSGLCTQVLKDPGKRATYDAIKDGFPSRRSPRDSGGTATYTDTDTSYTTYKPGGGTPEQDPFDEFFAKWWAKREHE